MKKRGKVLSVFMAAALVLGNISVPTSIGGTVLADESEDEAETLAVESETMTSESDASEDSDDLDENVVLEVTEAAEEIEIESAADSAEASEEEISATESNESAGSDEDFSSEDSEKSADSDAESTESDLQAASAAIMSTDENSSAEAAIGDAEYATIEEAFEAAASVEGASEENPVEIVLLETDITVSTGIELEEGTYVELTVEDAESSYTITNTATSASKTTIFTVNSGASLTVDAENLTITYSSTKTKYRIVYCEGDFTLESGILDAYGCSVRYGIVDVAGSGTFTMNGGSLRNAKCTSYTDAAGVAVSDEASFCMNGGILSDIKVGTSGSAGVRVTDQAAFTMTGGTISNIEKTTEKTRDVEPSPVLVLAEESEDTPVFTMTGGTIEDNTGFTCGGGVSVWQNSSGSDGYPTFKMSGGVIQNNAADNDVSVAMGGGVYVYGSYAVVTIEDGLITGNTAGGELGGSGGGIALCGDGLVFTMTGGTVSDNSAVYSDSSGGYGGGIYVDNSVSNCSIEKGTITGNSAACGGGIYIEENTSLSLSGTVVTGNTAAALGGGIWSGPSGSLSVYELSGGAVYGNDAGISDSEGNLTKTSAEAGDDIAFVKSSDSDSSDFLFLDEEMLGGGSASYYVDGGILSGDGFGTADSSAERYAEGTSEEINVSGSLSENVAAKNVVTEDAASAALESAALTISGNSAEYGGGIGCRGTLTIGEGLPEARIGETEYATLEEAFEAAAELDSSKDNPVTVTLLEEDIKVESSIILEKGTYALLKTDDEEVSYKVTKISSSEDRSVLFEVSEGASLTIDAEYLTLLASVEEENSSEGIIDCEGEFILENGTLDMDKDVVANGCGIVTISESGVFTMSGGAIQNASLTENNSACVLLRDEASFIMDDGTITKSAMSGSNDAGVLVRDSAVFTMNGGTISNLKADEINSAVNYSSSAVKIYARTSGDTPKFILNGGTIKENSGFAYGGGVLVVSYLTNGSASLEINGGSIQNNKADSSNKDVEDTCGGGVCAAGESAQVMMTGGSINGNEAGVGGGMYLQYGGTIKGGNISGNTASSEYGEGHGGGIYSDSGTLYLYNVLVTENIASELGGGLWACNTGDIEIYVTEGGAVYDNDAGTSDSDGNLTKTSGEAGDDVASVSKGKSVNSVLQLADRILGGGDVDWYVDGGVSTEDYDVIGLADDKMSRYDNEETHTLLAALETADSVAAIDIVETDDAVTLAESEAELVISGNSAVRGGGIATNGNAVIGEDKSTSLTVTKVWEDSNDQYGLRPESITLSLYNTVTEIGEDGSSSSTKYLIDTETITEKDVTVNEDGSWTYTFDDLPVGENYSYSVNEENIDGYTVAYSDVKTVTGDGTSEDEDSYEVTVTNSLITGSLQITKMVSGLTGDDEMPSGTEFTVTGPEDYSCTFTFADFTEDEEDGTWTYTLTNLPAGTYTVTENKEGAAVEGYTLEVTGSGSEAEVTKGETAWVEITNAYTGKETQKIVIETGDSEESETDDSISSGGTETEAGTKTGDSGTPGLWTLILLCAGAVIAAAAGRKRIWNR